MYAGADLTGYGIVYRHNFFHHLMHVPGQGRALGHPPRRPAGRIDLHRQRLLQVGGQGDLHERRRRPCPARQRLPGGLPRASTTSGAGSQRNYDRQEAILEDPNHMYRNTKENYVGPGREDGRARRGGPSRRGAAVSALLPGDERRRAVRPHVADPLPTWRTTSTTETRATTGPSGRGWPRKP